MKNLLIVFGLIGILGVQSCGKGKNPIKIPTPHPLLQEYFKHKPGTIWVYNIEGTNDTTIDHAIEPQNSPYDFTQIISQQKPFKFSFESDLGTDMCVRFADDWSSYGHCMHIENDTFISLPKIYYPNSDSTGILDSVLLNGLKYYNVIKSNDNTMAQFREYWFAPGVGIIKKVQHSNGGIGKTFTLRSFKPAK